ESTLSEFTGLRMAQAVFAAGFQTAFEQTTHDGGAAMALKLEDVFTGVGVWPLEEQDNACIYGLAVGIFKRQVMCVPWGKRCAEQALHNGCQVGPGKAYDANAAAPGGGGDGSDGLMRGSGHGYKQMQE